jgi:vancomycin resistance protein YoaR
MVASLIVAMLFAAVASILVVQLWLSDRVVPGVYVWDVDLGGLPRDEAMEHLDAHFQYPTDRHPTLHYSDRTWNVELADLGARLDVAATVDAALVAGHSGNLITRLREQLDVFLQGRQVMPVFSSDPGTAAMFLSQIARQVNRPLRNATLTVREDLSVEVIPGQTGREVDGEATGRALLNRIAEIAGGRVDLVVIESERLPVDLEAIRSQVIQVLSAPISLTAPDLKPWVIEPATLTQWLILRPVTGDNGQATLSVGLDPGQTRLFANEIAAQVDRPPVDAQFRFDAVNNELVSIVESVPGRTLEVTATMELVQSAAASEERTVSLPILSIRPTLATEDAASLGIVELIAAGRTTFAGSTASRVRNIEVGAAQFDGILIEPGQTFSFNHYLGEVSAERGYEESIIIWGNTTRADVGGGLCQVSSTAFRAAFWAGVPITERVPHAFRVSYYEPPLGLDATIYSPHVDLKWVNDTGHHILIQTYLDKPNSTLTFAFYGTKPNRTVEMDGPYEDNLKEHGPPIYRDDPTLAAGKTKQIEWAKDGLDVTIYRVIKENDIEVSRDTFFSRYRPWQAIYLVGTKED